jgi:thiol-disulfide isomerase/thioredoxin
MDLVSGRTGLARALAAATLLLAALPAAAETGAVPARVNPYGLSTYPDAARTCPHLPRGQFARCVAQSDILNAAAARARTSGKRVLVLVGADWCVWCVVLNRYIDGWADPALEPMAAGTAGDADTLARFVARNFVVAELNAESTDIAQTLQRAQLTPGAVRELPAAFVISHGAVQVVDFRRAELTKGSTKGYSRLALLRILRQSVTLAQADHAMATTAD